MSQALSTIEEHEINIQNKTISLEDIKSRIEMMGKNHHIEILKILKKNPSNKLNENKSGVYINLSFLPEDSINEIMEYLGYINDQESALRSMETQKQEFKNIFFVGKENKEDPLISYSVGAYSK
jgi:hypothetical protein